MMRAIVIALAFAAAQSESIAIEETSARGNPIRKVVTMLQMITKKVEKEGKEAEDLFDKFMCECKKTQASLETQIATGESSGSDQASALEAGKGQQVQLTQDIVDAKAARVAAKEAIATATALREKEAKAYAASKADSEANIAAMAKALDALHKGVGGSFLQTDAANTLRQLVQNKQDLFGDNDREEVSEFLQSGMSSEFSGEIIGILEQLKEEMSKDLSDAVASEKDAIETYDQFVAAKTKEFETLQAAIEEKMARLGELGVANAQLANSIGDVGSSMGSDKSSLADLKTECAQRSKDYEAEKKSRIEELAALADTVKMLNDDDALDLFKKALPGASSLVQITARQSTVRARVMAMIKADQQHHKSTKFDFIALALRGKKAGFTKVIALIEKMVNQLAGEQVNDDARKVYCLKEFDESDDEKKSLERKVNDAETAIMDAKETLQTLVQEISSTQAAIVENDKLVEDATAQRQSENAAYKTLMTENTAALELIKMAKNRMNKFYNPSLYVAPPKRELSREDRIAVNMGGTAPPTPAPGGIAGTGITALVQISMHTQFMVAKKGEEANGVVAMMDLLLKDLESQMTTAETEEKNAQEDYMKALLDAKDKRTADAKLLDEKISAKAETDSALQTHGEDKHAAARELMANGQYIASLHADCDWLLQHYDQRTEARNNEIDAIKKAKDVLNGADYSLLEVTAARSLRGSQ